MSTQMDFSAAFPSLHFLRSFSAADSEALHQIDRSMHDFDVIR